MCQSVSAHDSDRKIPPLQFGPERIVMAYGRDAAQKIPDGAPPQSYILRNGPVSRNKIGNLLWMSSPHSM